MRGNLKEIAGLFFKLGCISFGGPAAHIAMMQQEVVDKRKWMDDAHFLDLVGATNLIPGPNSTEMSMHCGYARGGVPGLFIAGLSFIVPAVLITGLLAVLYVSYGQNPQVAPFVFGIKPAVIAIICGAIFKLGKKALKSIQLGVLGVLVIAASLFGMDEILLILGAGILAILFTTVSGKALSVSAFPLLVVNNLPGSFSQFKLFLVFLKIGAVLFGSGYVLIAYLEAELINKLHWLTESQLMDAIAMGQFTPGPVLSTATFIGYQIGGLTGAILATAGIFLPSFLFVLLLYPFIPKLRSSKLTSTFLDAVNVAALAIMITVTLKLGYAMTADWRSTIIMLAALAVFLIYRKISAVWLVVGGSLAGFLLSYL